MKTLGAFTLALGTVAVVVAGGGGAASSAAPGCPSGTAPVFAGTTPTGPQVLGFEFGSREVTSAEINTYLDAVDGARDDVSVGTMATSVEGRPIRYAILGTPAQVAAAQEASARLRDPATTPAQAATIAASAPAIAWMAGNVHGTEESGGDAALRMLYELADRTDCAARGVRENTVVVVVPTQNPDGREADTRRNASGFDLNRDWFAATQPETGGKLDLLMTYPPVLLTDNHEYGGNSFFFPPNADPIHHEIADRSVDWVNHLYGGAMAAEFDRQKWKYFNYTSYDLLYMGYGDTVPTTALLGAGMTFEKGNGAKIAARTEQQFAATWASLTALADNKTSVLEGLAGNYREAYAEGVAGQLEPNAVFAPGSVLERQVPDERVRSYFIEDKPGKRAETALMLRRLQRLGVEVRRLTAPLAVPDYTPYAAAPRAVTLPAGTYYIPMAQAQKHWVQAMLGEDAYVPFAYFYDVTAWSNPLLGNLPGGRSGASLTPASELLAPQAEPGARTPGSSARVGLWLLDNGTAAFESEGWLRYLLGKKWRVPHSTLTTAQIRAGALANVDVLIAPDGSAKSALGDLGKAGRAAVTAWVAGGGRLIAWDGGASAAAQLGLTTALLTEPTSDIPGSLIKAAVSNGPLAVGVGDSTYVMYEYDSVMTTPNTSAVKARYPDAAGFFVSGYERGADELHGTAAVIAEPFAAGRVVLFGSDPNFRGFTGGTQAILWNAIYAAEPAAGAADVRSLPTAVAASKLASESIEGLGQRAVVTVRTTAATEVSAALRTQGINAKSRSLGGGLTRLSWKPADDADRNPELDKLLGSIDGVVSVRMP